ncbi:MAG: enoyl-CoA hydratase/isomerase family protein [Acidobacteriota bacterium]
MARTYKYLRRESRELTAWVTIDHPPYNVLTMAVMDELVDLLQTLTDEGDVKAVVLQGAGRAFSAGLDISEHTVEKSYQLLDTFHEIFRTMVRLDKPVVAAVRGPALGGGCELAMFCDMAIAGDTARFGQPEIKVGIFPPMATVIFPRLIGRRRAVELILTGDIIDAREAERIGMVNKVVPDAMLEEAVTQLVRKLAEHSAPVIQIARRAIYSAYDAEFPVALQRVEDIYLNHLMVLEDTTEGLKAFLQKRKPVWKNR